MRRHLEWLTRRARFASWLLTLSLLAPAFGSFATTSAQVAPAPLPITGAMLSQTSTLPRGAVFLPDSPASTTAGHWWVSDQLLGICRLDPQTIAGQPPFALTACNGTAKSGGQIVVGDAPSTAPAGSKYVYVADASTRSVNVVRFLFNPGTNGAPGSLSSALVMRVTNVTAVGGGSGGGRPVALALAPNGSDLYVGYIKSGDVMEVIGAKTATNGTPVVARIGSTSDGRGVNAFTMFGNDLYLAEAGGLGVSKIADPSGVTRSACSPTALCTAAPLNPNPTFFPGGLVSAPDPTTGAPDYILIGTVALGGQPNTVLRYEPATGLTEVYSQTISPSYTSVGTTYTTYAGVLGLGYDANKPWDLLVGDDPQFAAALPTNQQGHFWRVANPAFTLVPGVTSIAPSSGPTAGGTTVTIGGTNLATLDATGAVTALPTVTFGANAATGVACTSATSCTAVSPVGTGTVDVRVTLGGGTSAAVAGDQFTYVAPPPLTGIAVTGIAPTSGATPGGTVVTITGQSLATVDPLTGAVTGLPTIAFGANAATSVTCATATLCTATSPAGAVGTVDVQVTLGTNTSPPVAADRFTYAAPSASLYAWGITAPKGGATWLPNSTGGGHWWSSDHAQGLCRQDQVPGANLHAINFAVCGDDIIGSAGQAVYDARANANGTHYVYVPDNAVRSTAVWRLTFDPVTETMVPDPVGGAMATAMTPLADVRTLKPNGMALGPDGNLYVTDLVEPNVRQITNPNGDPRTQVISIVAVSGDNRGANGTQGFIGNLLYISGNRATQFFDITQCPMPPKSPGLAPTPCGMASVPAPVGIFVAGSTTDPQHKLVYLSSSPGGANATIYRYDAGKDVYVAFPAGSVAPDLNGVVTCPACTVGAQARIYVAGGTLPAPKSLEGQVWCSVPTPLSAASPATNGCQRPWDQANHPTTNLDAPVPATFAFVFGLGMAPDGTLAITEDPSAGARSGRGTMWTVPYIP